MPGILSKIGMAFKAARQAFGNPANAGAGGLPGVGGTTSLAQSFAQISFIPDDGEGGTRVLDDASSIVRAGDLWSSSAASVCIGWINRNFPEADLVVEQRTGDTWEAVRDHPMIALLDDPDDVASHDFYTLWSSTLTSYLTDGNAYWLKERDGTGKVVSLRYLPHFQVCPIRLGKDKFLDGFLFTQVIDGQPKTVVIGTEDIVHFKDGQDLRDPLKGCSELKRQIMHVVADQQVGAYTADVLYNRGVLGLVVVPTQDDVIRTQEQADAIKAKLQAVSGGRNRGATVVMSGPVRVEQPNFNPSQLALTEISRIPEARICAALGVPAMVVGLSVGDFQKTYSNLGEAERQAWRNLRARQNRMGEALYRQLLTEFEPDRTDYRVEWDYSGVEALQDDLDSAFKRAGEAFRTYEIVTRAEAREMVGQPVAEDGSDAVYYTEYMARVAVGVGGSLTATGKLSLPPAALATPATNGTAKGDDGSDLPALIAERLELAGIATNGHAHAEREQKDGPPPWEDAAHLKRWLLGD